MDKKEGRVSESDNRVSKYRAISTDIWDLFKKYLPISADLTTFVEDVHALDQKYKGQDGYLFMQKLLKVYFDELKELKG